LVSHFESSFKFSEVLTWIGESDNKAAKLQEYYEAADQERGIGFEYLETGGGAEAAGVRFELDAARRWRAPLNRRQSGVVEGERPRLQVS